MVCRKNIPINILKSSGTKILVASTAKFKEKQSLNYFPFDNLEYFLAATADLEVFCFFPLQPLKYHTGCKWDLCNILLVAIANVFIFYLLQMQFWNVFCSLQGQNFKHFVCCKYSCFFALASLLLHFSFPFMFCSLSLCLLE